MMNDKRVVYTNLCGRQYPLCLTVAAQNRICDEFGGLVKMAEAMDKAGERATSVLCQVSTILIEGGIGRMKSLAWMEGKEADEICAPDSQTLENLLTIAEVSELRDAVFNAITASRQQTVETEPDKSTSKNAETTQE